jgi:putative membrane protein
MSLRAVALDWSLDGTVGAAFLVLVLALAAVYLLAAEQGRRRDRRGRRWPPGRTACFLAGLIALIVDLYSGIGTEADARLSVHMLEHMIMWLVVAPLLAAAAPIRLAFYALPRGGRRALGRCLRSRPVSLVAGPAGSVALFSAVLLVAHLPAVYGLALSNDYVHELEHGLFLLTSLLVWAPLLRVDPLPHRLTTRGQIVCMAACMVPMALVAAWLSIAPSPVYGHYADVHGVSALHDQRVAAAIMWIAGLPAFVVPALARLRIPRRVRAAPLGSHGAQVESA